MQISQLLSRINEPQTILMAKLSRALKTKGIEITDLSLGEPDFATPPHIIAAATEAMQEGYTKYPPVAGYPELRASIAQKLKRDNGLIYTPEQIVVSTGAKQALANVVASLINPEDEVIIPTPYWVTYASLVALNQGKCKFIPCSIEESFKLNAKKLEAAITEKTKMIIFSSPCNPTGAVYSKRELEELKNVLVKHPSIVVVSDEIYELINYTAEGHQSIAQFDDIKEQVVIVNGFSKGYAMTGWRLGYLAATPILAKACEKYQSQITSGANTIAQRAAIAALEGSQQPSKQMTQAFKERRDYFINALAQIEGIKIKQPDGAFYAFPDISCFYGKTDGKEVIKNADDFAMYLLNKGHLTGVSGAAFGDDACIRFSFATSMDNLQKAIAKIQKALSALT